jgi:hypothetical protein
MCIEDLVRSPTHRHIRVAVVALGVFSEKMIAATTAMAARPGDGRPIEAGRESTADPLPPDARSDASGADGSMKT